MALVVADRVQETTTTTGTGTVTLAGASAGYQSFATIGNGNTTYYTLTSGNNWEVGIGTYTSSGTTLARTTVLASSAGGTTKITLSGTSNVFVTYPAEIATMLGNPTATNGGVVYGTGTAIGVSAVGTVSGYQFLQSAGAASPTWVQIPSFKDVAVAPSSPAPIEGDRFFDNTSGIEYDYITTASGNQWVETSAAGTPTNGVFSTMALGGATLGSNALAVTGTTALSGLLTAAGGVSSTLTTDATSATTGSIITAGGISTQKALWVGTTSTFAGAMTYGGVTLSNSVTGTGKMVLATAPTLSTSLTLAAGANNNVVMGQWTGGGGAYNALSLNGSLNTFQGLLGGSSGDTVLYVTSQGGLILIAGGSNAIEIGGTQAVRMNHYGAGTATFDSSGNITSVSDPSLKTRVGDCTDGLKEVLAIAADKRFMGQYRWNEDSGMEQVCVYSSFFAFDDFPVSAAVAKDASQRNSFSDRPVTMALVNAVAEMENRITALEAKVK